MEFNVAKRGSDPIQFSFSDEPDYEYEFTAPKSARSILTLLDGDYEDPFLVTRTNRDWLQRGLSDEQWAHIEQRLFDEKVALDWKEIDVLIKWLNEQVEGRPTG